MASWGGQSGCDLNGAETAHADFTEEPARFEAAGDIGTQIDKALAVRARRHKTRKAGGIRNNVFDDRRCARVDAGRLIEMHGHILTFPSRFELSYTVQPARISVRGIGFQPRGWLRRWR